MQHHNQNYFADANNNFMCNFVRKTNRRNCFYDVNAQEILKKLETVIKSHHEI